jgi:hypothetical protein
LIDPNGKVWEKIKFAKIEFNNQENDMNKNDKMIFGSAAGGAQTQKTVNSSKSEESEFWASYREDINKRKDKRMNDNVEKLKALNIDAVEQSKNVWRIESGLGTVIYWPGTNGWQFKTKTIRGDFNQFVAWLKQWGFVAR